MSSYVVRQTEAPARSRRGRRWHRLILAGLVAGVAVAGAVGAAPAVAYDHWDRHYHHGHYWGPRFFGPPGVYVAPPVVYAPAPPPVAYAPPPPVYYGPPGVNIVVPLHIR